MRNLILLRGVLSDVCVAELAVDGVLNRYLLLCVQCASLTQHGTMLPGSRGTLCWRPVTGEQGPLRHAGARQSPDRSPLRVVSEAALVIRARRTRRTSWLAAAGTGSAGATSRNRNGPGSSGLPLGCASRRMKGPFGTNHSYVDGGQTSREPRDQCLSNDLCRDDVEYLSYGGLMN